MHIPICHIALTKKDGVWVAGLIGLRVMPNSASNTSPSIPACNSFFIVSHRYVRTNTDPQSGVHPATGEGQCEDLPFNAITDENRDDEEPTSALKGKKGKQKAKGKGTGKKKDKEAKEKKTSSTKKKAEKKVLDHKDKPCPWDTGVEHGGLHEAMDVKLVVSRGAVQ